MEKTLGADEARRQFEQIIEEAFYRHDRFIVERGGRPMAAIVSVDDYKAWQRLAKDRVFELVEPVWARNSSVPEDELDDDVRTAIEQLRRKNRDEKESTGT